MLNRHWRLALGAMCVSGIMCGWVGGASAQPTYTDTVTHDLANGETVDTSPAAGTVGPPPHGYGVYAEGKAITLQGDNTITTSGSNAVGIFVRRTTGGPDASVTATGTGYAITTTGNGVPGVLVQNVDITGTATATLTNVAIVSSDGGFGAVRTQGGGQTELSIAGSSVTSTNGIGLNLFYATAMITDTAVTAAGMGVYATSSTVTISGTSHITTTGNNGATGIYVAGADVTVGNGVIVETWGSGSHGIGIVAENGPGSVLTAGAATVTTHGDASAALFLTGTASFVSTQSTLTGTVFTTTGKNAAAFVVEQHANVTNAVTANGVTLTTGNAGSHGVVFTGSGTGTNQVTFDAASKITTTGAGAHGVSVQNGATQTLDVAANAGPGVLVLPSNGANISIQGPGSALVQAQDAGSKLTIKGNGLPLDVNFGADAWGVIAENGGTVNFTTAATTQGYGLWARGPATGTIAFGDTSTADGSRVKVDAGGVLDLTGSTLGNFPIRSLEGTGTGTVHLGANTLAIDGVATTTYAGTIDGSGGLKRSGLGTTILTGDNTYTGSTLISGGTLQLGDGGASGSIMGEVLVTHGKLVFNRSDEYDFGGRIFGHGAVEQNGTGNTVFNAAQDYTGPTTINAGTLTVNSTLESHVTVKAAGTLAGIGTIENNVTNAGTVSPGTGGVNEKLTIEGNYVGQAGSKLAIRTQLGDDSSPTSQLVISGAGNSASGDTGIVVTNAGGTGAQTTGKGIPIVVTTGGASSTATAFHLDNRVAAGPFEYLLYQGPGPAAPAGTDATSWFLRSQNDAGDVTHRPEVPCMRSTAPWPVSSAS